jgi:hypothetical protein
MHSNEMSIAELEKELQIKKTYLTLLKEVKPTTSDDRDKLLQVASENAKAKEVFCSYLEIEIDSSIVETFFDIPKQTFIKDIRDKMCEQLGTDMYYNHANDNYKITFNGMNLNNYITRNYRITDDGYKFIIIAHNFSQINLKNVKEGLIIYPTAIAPREVLVYPRQLRECINGQGRIIKVPCDVEGYEVKLA